MIYKNVIIEFECFKQNKKKKDFITFNRKDHRTSEEAEKALHPKI